MRAGAFNGSCRSREFAGGTKVFTSHSGYYTNYAYGDSAATSAKGAYGGYNYGMSRADYRYYAKDYNDFDDLCVYQSYGRRSKYGNGYTRRRGYISASDAFVTFFILFASRVVSR